jgi:hypothetical protein
VVVGAVALQVVISFTRSLLPVGESIEKESTIDPNTIAFFQFADHQSWAIIYRFASKILFSAIPCCKSYLYSRGCGE